ncbi:heterokaryon incompatibility protein [Colletotrichum kahawae]|uniref:Heterokaryon incompatibility protein n=1 Tax=Colletotrichum kahawae TaxID=34407 RepID=A0AAE0DDW1_COLKA|nr:heterokaryon incompatibility protein [Colletotrichum kahawae]
MAMLRSRSLPTASPDGMSKPAKRLRQASSDINIPKTVCHRSLEIEGSLESSLLQDHDLSANFQSTASPEYTRLPNAGTYVRLLSFQTSPAASSSTVDVRCVLHTFPLAQVPQYNAISYTWGPEAPTTPIEVDGQLKSVRLNCELVLRRARQHDPTALYWIDAICIDQENLEEKGHQVAIMGKVFGASRLVIAYVGEHADDSRFLCKKLQNHAYFFKWVGRNQHWLGPSDRALARLWFFLIRYKTLPRMLIAFKSFLRRVYFQRVWVYQELFLGKQVYVQCGESLLHIRMYHGFAAASQIWGFMKVQEVLERLTPSDDLFLRTDTPKLEMLVAGSFQQQSLPLATLIEHVNDFLSLVHWGGEEPLLPDYTMDVFQLGVELLSRAKGSPIHSADFLLQYAELVVKILRLHDELSPRLEHAIHIRNHKNTASGLMNFASGTKTSSCHTASGSFFRGGVLWSGIRLARNETGEWVYPVVEGHAAMYRIVRSILLPPMAAVDDWCLFQDYEGYEQILLIIREHADRSRYWIVGKGLARYKPKFSSSNRFRLYIDTEDFLVIASQSFCFNDSLGDVEDAQEYLATGVCGVAGSSYAEWADSVV